MSAAANSLSTCCVLLSTNVDGLFVDGSKTLDGTKGRLMSNRDTVLVLLGVM